MIHGISDNRRLFPFIAHDRSMKNPWNDIMQDAARGEKGEYYIEREDGRVDTHIVSDYTQLLLEWSEPERLGIQHASGKVLDIGCGAGRVALYLQSLGCSVVGIDLAPGAINACIAQGLEHAHVMAATELEFPDGMFDTIILYGNNFGVPGEEQNIISMLQRLHQITKPDGIIIAGSSDVQLTDDQSNLMYQRKNLERGRPRGLVKLRVKYKDIVGDWVELRLASPEEMKNIAEKVGWKLSRVYQRGASYVGILTKR